MRVKVGDVRLFFDVEGTKLVAEGPWMRERQTVVGLEPRGTDDDRRETVRARPEDDRRCSPGPREDRTARVRRLDLRLARSSGELLRRREQGPARRQAVSGQADRRAFRGDVGGGRVAAA